MEIVQDVIIDESDNAWLARMEKVLKLFLDELDITTKNLNIILFYTNRLQYYQNMSVTNYYGDIQLRQREFLILSKIAYGNT